MVSSHRAILGNTKAFWIPYAGYYLARNRYYTLLSDAQVYVHSEDTPRWIKHVIDNYYALVLYPYSESAPRWVRSATERYWELRHKYGFGILRYKYESIRAHRARQRSNRVVQALSKRR